MCIRDSIAPSANPEGLSPAKDILEAKRYFNDSVDLYVDGGEIFNKASKVIKLNAEPSAFNLITLDALLKISPPSTYRSTESLKYLFASNMSFAGDNPSGFAEGAI